MPGTIAGRAAAGCEGGLNAAVFLFFPLLVVLPRGVAALTSVAGLLAGGLLWSRGARPALRRGLAVPAAIFCVLVAWGLLSVAWSIDPLRALLQDARIGGLCVAGLAMAAAAARVSSPRRLGSFLLAGFIVAIVVATLDLPTHGALSKPFSTRVYQPAWLNQASVAFAIMALPAGAWLVARGRKITGLLFTAAVIATVAALAGTAAQAALAAGVAAALLCYWRRTRCAQIAAVLSVLVIVSAPLSFARLDRVSDLLATADSIKLSAGHRLLVWSFVGDRIAEHPLRGRGLDASRAIPGGGDPIRPGETWLPLHPHNAPLQLWLELGVPGAVLLALLAADLWLALGCIKWPRLYAAGAGGSLASAMVACCGTYGIWQEWWQGALWFSLFAILVLARSVAAADSQAS
jgi:O-antigen ligase